MAEADKLWFELGVRDEVSKVLETLMKTSEKLGDALTDDTAELKNYYRNIVDISNVYDKIHVTQKRIAGLKGLSLAGDQKKGLRAISDDIEKARKEMATIFKDPSRLTEKGSVQFDKMRLNIELMLKDSLRYIDGIEERDRAEAQNAANESRRIDELKSKYYELQQYRKRLSDAIVNAAPGTNLGDATSIINGISSRMSAVKRAERNGSGMPASASGADYENFLRRVKTELSSLTGATDDYNSKLQANKNIQAALNKLYLDAESQHKIASIRGQAHEYAALGQKMQDITRLLAAVKAEESGIANGNIAPTYTREKVNEELNAIQRRYNESLAAGRQMELNDALAKEKKAASTRKAMEAVSMLAHVNEGLVSSYSRIAEAGSNANRITVQLQQQIGAYAGLYGLERILKSVITIGGQFEVQHVALKNILGDIQEANVLFSQLQGLAVESPKTFQELTAYAKQLSAYQIPANELFDTTRRLADMSSGLGVDMNRLILAYGQVRSAAVLRGQELRQFTEAGIPMVQALADKFTQMNGKLTTTADVFALISKRAVPFEMVKEVLWDMTNQGGQFYNMQSELADTLFGKWQKLQDQWQITLGHIADGTNATGKALKWVLELAVSLASAFDTISPMLSGFAVGRLGTKMAQGIKETFDRRNGTAAITTMTLAKQKEAARLDRERVMYGRQLNQQEQQLVNRKNVLTANEMKLLLAEEKITEKQIVQLANAGKLNRLEMLKLLYAQGYTKQQIQQIVNGNLQILQQKQSNMLSNLKSGLMGFVGGWPGLVMTGIGALWSLYSYIEGKNEELSQKGEAMMSHAQQGANSLAKTLNSVEADGSTEKKIEALEEALLQLGSTGEAIVAKGREHMDDIDERWETLKTGANDYKKILESMGNQEGKALFEKAIGDSDIDSYIKKYDEAVNEKFKQQSSLERYSETYKAAIAELIASVPDLAGQLKGKSLFEQIDIIGVDRLKGKINEMREALRGTFEYGNGALAQSLGPLSEHAELVSNVNSRWEDIAKESIPSMREELRAAARNIGIENFDSLTPQQRQSLETLTREYVKAIENGSVEAKNKLAEELASQVFHIQIVGDLTIDKTKMSGFASYVWQKFGAGGALGDKGNIKVGKQVFTKAQVSNIFGDIDNFAKEYNSEWKKQTELAAKYHKAGAEQLENEAKQEAANIKSTLDALDLFDSGKSGRGSGGSKKDTALEGWKNMLRELQEFWREYEQLRKRMSDAEAIETIRKGGVFPSMFGKDGTPLVNVREGLEKTLRDFLATTNAITPDRKKFQNEILKSIFDVSNKDAEEMAQKMLKQMQEALARQSSQFDLYSQIMSQTGNVDLAMNAFVDGKVWNDQARSMAATLQQLMSENVVDGGVIRIDWDADEETAEQYYKSNFKNGNILYELWQAIAKLIRDNYVNGLKESASAAGSLLTEAEKVKKIEGELAELRRQGVADNDPRMLAKQKELEKAQADAFERSTDYLRFYEAILSMTITKAEVIGQKIRENLNKELKEGTKSANQYLREIKNIDAQMKKLREHQGGLSAFLTGGINGYLQNKYDAESDKFSSAAIEYQKASEQLLAAQKAGDASGVESAKAAQSSAKSLMDGAGAAMKGLQGAMGTVSVIDKIIHGIDGVVQGIKGTFDEIREMYEALGHDTNSESWQDWNTFLSSFSAASASATKGWDSLKSGDMGGVIQGVVGSFTGWITGFAKGHDAKRERLIQLSQEQINAINRMKESLERSLERTLGGIYSLPGSNAVNDSFTGDIEDWRKIQLFRRMGLGLFAPRTNISDEAIHAMEAAQQSRTYYDQSYALLLKQRDELQAQYNAEADKKDSDSEKLADYKAEIEGLQDSITHFAEDMAKTLYDIDFKSWASELGDALVSAWAAGESGAEAYKNKVSDILRSLGAKMITERFVAGALEPIMDSFLKQYEQDNGVLTKDGMEILGRMYDAGETLQQQVNDFMNGLDDVAEAHGSNLKDSDSSSSVSSGIKGVTEQTADLLASYINAIRADVSVNRIILTQILASAQTQNEMPTIARAQLAQLQQIAGFASRNAIAAEMIYELLHRISPDGTSFKIK